MRIRKKASEEERAEKERDRGVDWGRQKRWTNKKKLSGRKGQGSAPKNTNVNNGGDHLIESLVAKGPSDRTENREMIEKGKKRNKGEKKSNIQGFKN